MGQREVPLKSLRPGMEFRRPAGVHSYLVSNIREEKCGNVLIYCYNLTNGNAYFWTGRSIVTPIVRNITSLDACPAESFYCDRDTRHPHRFWMCLVEDGKPPTFRHQYEPAARIEAERLAKLTRKPVYLLETVGRTDIRVVPVAREVVWRDRF